MASQRAGQKRKVVEIPQPEAELSDEEFENGDLNGTFEDEGESEDDASDESEEEDELDDDELGSDAARERCARSSSQLQSCGGCER